MPIGLVFMKWDDREGSKVLTTYPKGIDITKETLMQVISAHEYSGESGMVSIMVGSLNIASYYTGPEIGYYILLLLNLDEDADAYEGGLADVSRMILERLNEKAYLEMIPSLFRRLSIYPTLSDEQSLALTYQDDIKRMIINRLRDEGVISKSELMIWLKDKYKKGFFDLEGTLTDLIKRVIIKEASVKGMASELIFLTNDILMFRKPTVRLFKDPVERGLPEQFAEDYRSNVKNFFLKYRPTEEDNLAVSEALVNPQVYETLRLLRTSIVTINDLEKLKKKGVDDIYLVLKTLHDIKMIEIFKDEKDNEYYALLSDFLLRLTFPSYILRVIKEGYEQRSKSDQVLIEYLNILEDTYFNLKDKSMIKK